jgi:hypothetical protein
MSEKRSKAYNVRAVERAVQILSSLDDEHPERSLSEIAQATGLHKATTHRILMTLLNCGFIDQAADGVTWGETLGSTGDYVVLSPGWHNGANFPGVDELNEKHQADLGRPSDVLVGPAYAIVQIVADAIERAGTLDRDAIRDAIAATDMTTVVGPVTFNEDGTGNVLNPLIQWQNGKLELVWPEDQATADFLISGSPI